MSIKLIRSTKIFAEYVIQKLTKYRYNVNLERELKEQAENFLQNELDSGALIPPERISLESLDLDDRRRFRLVRDDIYSRFENSAEGTQKDSFGRKGTWIPRGCKLYYDNVENDYIKVFEKYFCHKGEGAFLNRAIESGLYRFLCPNLNYLLIDINGDLRGYSIGAGRVLTRYEFERYIGFALRGVIETETKRTKLYFYDLTRHNVIVKDCQISFIDLESVLPLKWFEQGSQFAREHLDQVDLGWEVQTKWYSPGWYRNFVKQQAENVAKK